jgi:hypothetical protein
MFCPICDSTTPEGASVCPGCGLSVGLFQPVAAAAGTAESPGHPHLVGEIAEATGAPPPSTDSTGPAELAHPARFLPALSGWPRPAAPEPAPVPLPELPALEAGEPRAVLRRQLDSLFTLGRRLALDLGSVESALRTAIEIDDVPTYEALRRELFVRVAASLAEGLELALARRNELAALLATGTPDTELDASRASLARGDLLGTYRNLRRAEESLALLEDEWATVEVLALEAQLLAQTVRELGGDPSAALGPLAAAQEHARQGDREGAEPLMAGAVLAIWHLLAPRLRSEVNELVERLVRAESQGASTVAARQALHAMATDLNAHNLGAAVLAWRRARDAAAPGVAEPEPPVTPPAA